MQKFGQITLKKSNELYYFVWTEEGVDYERLDIFTKPESYNLLNTSNCEASYVRKGTEFILGDESLVKAIKESRTSIATMRAKQNQSIELKDGVVYMTITKESPDLNMSLKRVTKKALLYEEVWETSDVLVETGEITHYKDTIALPVNIDAYDRYDILSGFRQDISGGTTDYYSLEYLISKYHLEHIENYDFVVCDSEKQARERLYEWRDKNTKVKAVDLETTGVDIWMYGTDCITGVVLSYGENDGTYFPFRQEALDYNLPISFLEEILDTINNQPKDVKIVAHNGKFEIQGVWKEYKEYIKNAIIPEKFDPAYIEHALRKTFLRIDADTLVLSVLVNPIFKIKGAHSLKTLAQKITGLIWLELENIFKGEIRFNKLPKEYIRYYACADTANTIKVYNYLIDKLPKGETWLFEEVESKLIYVTAENEFYGLNTDEAKLLDNLKNEQFKVDTLVHEFKKIHKLAESDNINSPDLRRHILYDTLRCPIEVYTDKQLPSTSKVALKRIVNIGTLREYDKEKEMPDYKDLHGKTYVKGSDLLSNRFPSVVLLQAISKAEKELGAFKRLKKTSVKGRVKFGMNQVGAATGRRTSNAHQYSDAMKSCIVADSKHHYFWSADYKQIELRVLAYLAKQYDLIEMQKNWEIDIHRAILSIIKGKPMWSISDSERKKGKSVNFGVVYMMSKFGLAQSAKGPAYTEVDLIEADNAITDFYNGLPAIKRYVHQNEVDLLRDGYIKTEFQRYRHLYDLLDPEIPDKTKKSLIRAGNNTPVQGFAADLLKWVEVMMKDYIREKGWDEIVECDGVYLPLVRMMLSVHDEILLSSHESVPIEEIITMFKKCMEINIEGAPPFFAAPAMVENWYSGKSDAYEIPIGFRNDIVDAWAKNHTSLLHVETYLQDLDGYRMGRLKAFMSGLISQYKTSEEVAKHVTHDTFTHELISVFSNLDKFPEDKDKSHEERILAAVTRYMSGEVDDISFATEEDKVEYSLLEIMEEETGDIDEYIELDQYGRAVTQEEEELEVDDLEHMKAYYPPAFDKIEKSYALFMLDQVWIDLSSFEMEQVEDIHKEISQFAKDNGDYNVFYMIPGGKFNKPISMGFSIGHVKKEITEICKKYVKEETVHA